MTQLEVAAAAGCSKSLVKVVVRRFERPPRKRSELRLSFWEREEISLGLGREASFQQIAKQLGRSASTISREVGAQTGEYRAWRGEQLAETRSHRSRPRKLASNASLREEVERGLVKLWSPEQIANSLKEKHPDNPSMQVSHETIYKTLYLQGRGGLRKELASSLRGGTRTQRRPSSRSGKVGRIQGMVNISQRPPEANDRAVPGHWEGDLIKGALNRSSIGTLVERTTRFVMLLFLPNGCGAQQVEEALAKKIQELPTHLRRSLTWDQGGEMALHAKFTIDTGVDVYFCDPHSPWQRGSNENTNGLLRQYFPKGTNLDLVSEARLEEVAAELNERPRMTLNWRTPAAALDELLRKEAA
jgi:IS30 family transposase